MTTARHPHNPCGLLTAAFFVLLASAAGPPSAVRPAAAPLAGATDVEPEEHEGRAPTAEEIRPSVETACTEESYAPGTTATIVVHNRARDITLQIFRAGPERERTRGNSELRGVPVTSAAHIGTSGGRLIARVRVGDWPSGLYFVRLRAADGRVGFAPFVVRPKRLGEHPVAVVLPTLTWQAYNLRDDDGDGTGDTWYARWTTRTARLARPFLNRGVPYNFRRYDLPFLRWLAQTARTVDVLAQADVEAVDDGRKLADAYELIVFPGHHEYVTTREYDVVEAFRDAGGNLAFLSANNFFWQVVRQGQTIEKTWQWRDLGRPEAALIGVQYRANDGGTHRAPWIVRGDTPMRWVFAGTGLRPGSAFGSGGIEIDATTAASPRTVQVLAEIPNLFGRGFTAQMSYYETPAGARVFAAGAFRLVSSADDRIATRLLANLWAKLARP
jgi:hypothetical protein